MNTIAALCCVWVSQIGTPEQRLWHAICVVESGCNVSAVGDNGRAVGIAQIHPIMVDDVNRILTRKTYTLLDRLDPVKLREMFVIYVTHYFPKGTPEQWSRCWNGGPKGMQKLNTIKYWKRIQGVI